jgi:hypothetical protein
MTSPGLATEKFLLPVAGMGSSLIILSISRAVQRFTSLITVPARNYAGNVAILLIRSAPPK